ncbi:MAG: hypothetical protein JOZ16_10140 [Methylobacteriaceae bacterium]|nr:hypothetical protein [Methylobacteriaceae bacterium]
MRAPTLVTGAAFAASLLIGSAVFSSAVLAQQSGTTSGPAAGSTVAPTTGMPNSSDPGKPNASPQADRTNVSGAPGVPGKPGSKSGPAEKK